MSRFGAGAITSLRVCASVLASLGACKRSARSVRKLARKGERARPRTEGILLRLLFSNHRDHGVPAPIPVSVASRRTVASHQTVPVPIPDPVSSPANGYVLRKSVLRSKRLRRDHRSRSSPRSGTRSSPPKTSVKAPASASRSLGQRALAPHASRASMLASLGACKRSARPVRKLARLGEHARPRTEGILLRLPSATTAIKVCRSRSRSRSRLRPRRTVCVPGERLRPPESVLCLRAVRLTNHA